MWLVYVTQRPGEWSFFAAVANEAQARSVVAWWRSQGVRARCERVAV